MPIAQLKPTVTIPPKDVSPIGDLLKEKEVYKTATADSAIQPPQSLLAYMDGMPWSVQYFSQVISKHDDIREVDIGQNAALQQYKKVNHFELKVQSDLQTSVDQETGRTDVTGTSIVISIIPNQFDYFVADASTRGRALFMVTNSTRMTYNNESVYEIDYALVGYVDEGTTKDRYEALLGRSVTEYYYVKERVIENLQPLLTKEEHGLSLNLNAEYRTIFSSYLENFVSPRDKLLVLPDPDEHIYDPRLADFVRKIADSHDTPSIYNVQRVSVDREPFYAMSSVLTVIAERDASKLGLCMNKAGKVSRSFFKQNSFLTSTNCWKVESYIYPDSDSQNTRAVAYFSNHPKFSTTDFFDTNLSVAEGLAYEALPTNLVRYAERDILKIKQVNKGSYYIFSEDFYKQTEQCSLLEILVLDYLNKRPLNRNHLSLLVEQWYSWPAMEAFYYTPILLVLIKEATREFYR